MRVCVVGIELKGPLEIGWRLGVACARSSHQPNRTSKASSRKAFVERRRCGIQRSRPFVGVFFAGYRHAAYEPVWVKCESGGSVKIPCKQAIYQGILQNLIKTRTLMRFSY